MQQHLVLLIVAVFSECLAHKTCVKPILLSPISPSISLCGKAATESITIYYPQPRTDRLSAISKAVRHCRVGEFRDCPHRRQVSCIIYYQKRVRSIKAAKPPFFWLSAMACIASVVLPETQDRRFFDYSSLGLPHPRAARVNRLRDCINLFDGFVAIFIYRTLAIVFSILKWQLVHFQFSKIFSQLSCDVEEIFAGA